MTQLVVPFINPPDSPRTGGHIREVGSGVRDITSVPLTKDRLHTLIDRTHILGSKYCKFM